MNTVSQPHSAAERMGTVEAALEHAKRLLENNPELAAQQAHEILSVLPGLPQARLVLGAAHRRAGRPRAALEVLEPLAGEQANAAPVHLELGIARAEAGEVHGAVAALRRAVSLQPKSADGWRLLADYLDAEGDAAGADEARAQYISAATRDPRLTEAAAALLENNLPQAERRLRTHLAAFPTDVAALRMLAEVAGRLRRYADAEELLERCLKLAPSFDAARHNYAVVLNRQAKPAAALPEVERLLAKEPRNPGYLNLKAAVLANMGEYPQAIGVYEAVLKTHPQQPKIWMSYGHALKTERRQQESVAAYRRALAMQPTLGEACWSLANLKTFRFTEADILSMRAALARPDLSTDDRVHFEFSLGKALEDAGSYGESFAHYARGNALHRQQHPYSADENTRFTSGCRQLYTAEFFAAREAAGAPERIPSSSLGCRGRDPPCSSRYSRAIRRWKARSSCRTFRRSRASSPDETSAATRAVFSIGSPRSSPYNYAAWESGISPPPGCIGKRGRPSSSTRCPTIASTSG